MKENNTVYKTSARLHVLVAEDNPVIQKTVQLLLSRWGILYTVVPNGKEAMEALKQQQFDCVLMDINMPVMDGLEATRAIRLFDTKTPIVAFTTHDEPEMKEKMLASGMSAYLNKSSDPTLIHKTILDQTLLLKEY